MKNVWLFVASIISLLFIGALFFIGHNIGKCADAAKEMTKEIKETRATAYEIMSSPQKSRELARGFENWYRWTQR